MSAAEIRRRYLFLLVLRWFPVGLIVPVLVLLPLERGLTVAEIGLAAAMQGVVVLVLELPTGGLSDSWGRRPVLLVGSCVALGATALFVVADSLALFAASYLLQGIYRALDSGPLESWYVDSALAADPSVRLDRGLSAGGTALGLGIAGGALVTGGLVAWVEVPGVPTLVLPVLLILVVQLCGLLAIVLLVHEPPHPAGRRRFLGSVREVPRVVGEGVRLVRASRVLVCLLLVEAFWGFGVVTYETLMPVRLAEQLGDRSTAAVLTGPANSVAWLVSAAGAALVPLLTARIGTAVTGLVLCLVQGAAVGAMGLLAGPAGVLAGFLAAYLVHGAANPVHMTLLHEQVSGAHRTTVVSMNSMLFQAFAALGMVVLTGLVTGASTGTAMLVGGLVMAAAAPLYLPARARRRQQVAV
ncbi:MFS transporter [Actinophytocola xanthii]|uniref:MFS transporter n=1 Tax=Actinophytocola xanthii TaxID=1912961 RepID=A0A1Q8C6B2_9PSEU|nr:MFS transporter [Actinophytocola xanthii]OLF09905.1 MFS transporter [Actinophytocola xanthii]